MSRIKATLGIKEVYIYKEGGPDVTHRLDRMSRTKDASGIKEVYIKRDQRRLTVKQECQEETIGIWSTGVREPV